MWNNTNTFVHYDIESLSEAWERYKTMLMWAPYNRMPRQLQVETFYDVLNYITKNIVSGAVGKSLYRITTDEAYELIEAMTYHYQNLTGYSMPNKAVGIYEPSHPYLLKLLLCRGGWII